MRRSIKHMQCQRCKLPIARTDGIFSTVGKAVKKTTELVKGKKEDEEQVEAIYQMLKQAEHAATNLKTSKKQSLMNAIHAAVMKVHS